MTDALTPPVPAREAAALGAPAAPPSMRRQLLGFARRLPWKRTVVLALRFLVNPILTRRWWRFLLQFAAARALPPPDDALLQPSLAIFLTRRARPRERLSWLIQHFERADRVLAPAALRRLWSGDTILIGEIAGKRDTYRVDLLLACRAAGRHEGVFALRLLRIGDEIPLCTTKFTLIGDSACTAAVIGGMQGGRDAKRAIIAASRDLGGLRPKDASLLVLQGLLVPSPCRYFFGVSQANHPSTTRHRRRRDRLHADIDGFWRDRAGVAERRFGFLVPYSHVGRTETRRDAMKQAFFALGAQQIRPDAEPQRPSDEKAAPPDPSDAA